MALIFQRNKNTAQKISTMNASALVVFLLLFLLSTFAHANHVAKASINVEQQDCYICQQALDTTPDLPIIHHRFIVSYTYVLIDIISVLYKDNDYAQPQLRAPPVFQ